MNTSPRTARRRAPALVPTLLGMGTVGALVGAAFANDWPELRGDTTRRGVASEKVVPPLSLLWRFTGAPQNGNPCSPAVVGDTAFYATRAPGDPPRAPIINSGTPGGGFPGGAPGGFSGGSGPGGFGGPGGFQGGGGPGGGFQGGVPVNTGGIVYAVDTRTGSRKWQYPRDNNGLRDKHLFLTAPSVYGDRVYIGASDGNLYVLNAKTGDEIIRYRTGRAINSAPTLAGGVLYFGSNDGTFYALKPETGEPAWNQLYRPGDGINSAPIVADGLIFFTTSDNTVHAVRQATGIPAWRSRQLARVLANAPVYTDATLYVPAGPYLSALQPARGGTRWVRQLPLDILAAPVAEAGVVYVMCRETVGGGALLYAFRSNNGKDFWAKPVRLPVAPSAAPTISGDVIYIPTQRNMILAVSREDGKRLWEYYIEPSSARPVAPGTLPPAQVSVTAPISVAAGSIFAVTDDGTLHAFRPDAPDTNGPLFDKLYPPPARQISGQPPLTLAAEIRDPGSGLNPETITVKLDERDVTATYDPNRSLVIYQTKSSGKIVDPPLANGRHKVSVTAVDWRGNKSEHTWSFVVNNQLPPPTSREQPAAPRAARPGAGKAPATGGAPGTNTPGGRGNRRGGRGNQGGGAAGGGRGSGL